MAGPECGARRARAAHPAAAAGPAGALRGDAGGAALTGHLPRVGGYDRFGSGRDWLSRALDYPYRLPRRSYLYRDGGVFPLPEIGRDRRLAGRVPVLAFGSNQAPTQLARKYAGWPRGTEIPVTLGWLAGHDVVYSAHFTRYGALPERLAAREGVAVRVAVTWLTQPQLDRMHETEGRQNYGWEERALSLRLEGGRRLTRAFLYANLRPPLLDAEGAPVPLAAIPAHGRPRPGLRQREALAAARDALAPGEPLEAFLRRIVRDAALREEMAARLAELRLGRSSVGAQPQDDGVKP